MLNIALSNGTLEARTMAFFEKAGIILGRTSRCYQAEVVDPRISRVSFMRPPMIPMLVHQGCYDLAVVGSDVLAEIGRRATILAKLDFTARNKKEREFRVVLFGAKDDPAKSIEEIPQGCTILSEFPRITRLALWKAGVRAKVERSFGTTEANVPHDFPYGVCIASTGETLEANGLKVVHVLSVETTVLIGGLSRLDGGQKEEAARSLVEDLMKVVDLS